MLGHYFVTILKISNINKKEKNSSYKSRDSVFLVLFIRLISNEKSNRVFTTIQATPDVTIAHISHHTTSRVIRNRRAYSYTPPPVYGCWCCHITADGAVIKYIWVAGVESKVYNISMVTKKKTRLIKQLRLIF